MTFATLKDKEDNIPQGAVIKDEAGQIAVVLGRYASGTRWVYILCYMDYELREASSCFGQWQVADTKCSVKQFVSAYWKAMEQNDLFRMSVYALHVLGALSTDKDRTEDDQEYIKAAIEHAELIYAQAYA